MKLSIYAFAFVPLAHAWTFLYTNATGNATILHDTGPSNCTQITLAANKPFSWDPEGQNLCISIYHDHKCDNRGGLSCGVNGAWKKDASSDFWSIQVIDNGEPSSSATPTPTPTSTTATSMTTSTSSTETSPTATATSTSTSTTAAAAASSSGSSSLSGGAIAGIVVGVIAGIAIIGALFFLYGRRSRNRQQAAAANELLSSSPQGPYTPQSPMTAVAYPPSSSLGTSEKGVVSSTTPSVRPAPGSRVVELAGHDPSAELVNSPISELDGQSGGKQFYRF